MRNARGVRDDGINLAHVKRNDGRFLYRVLFNVIFVRICSVGGNSELWRCLRIRTGEYKGNREQGTGMAGEPKAFPRCPES